MSAESSFRRGKVLLDFAELNIQEVFLGMALIRLHSAVEKHLRSELESKVLNRVGEAKEANHKDLLEMWKEAKLPLSEADEQAILRMNSLRNRVAHDDQSVVVIGEPVTVADMRAYAQFVARFIGFTEADEPDTRAALPDETPEANGDTAVQFSSNPLDRQLSCLLRVGIVLILILVAAVVATALLGNLGSPWTALLNGGREPLPAYIDENSPQLWIINDALVRSEPSMERGALIDAVNLDSPFNVLANGSNGEGSWYKIRLPDRREGWIQADRAVRTP